MHNGSGRHMNRSGASIMSDSSALIREGAGGAGAAADAIVLRRRARERSSCRCSHHAAATLGQGLVGGQADELGGGECAALLLRRWRSRVCVEALIQARLRADAGRGVGLGWQAPNDRLCASACSTSGVPRVRHDDEEYGCSVLQ